MEKNSGKCQPLMCKNSENGAELPISKKSCGWETAWGPPTLAARATLLTVSPARAV